MAIVDPKGDAIAIFLLPRLKKKRFK